jgi:hypothetical protein
VATAGLHQHGNASLMLNDQRQHDLVAIGAMISAIAFGEVHDWLRGRIVAVRATIDMQTRTVEVRRGRTERQAFGGRGGNERVEFGDPLGIESVESSAQGIIVELFC